LGWRVEGLGVRVEGLRFGVSDRTESKTVHEVFGDRKAEREVCRRFFVFKAHRLLCHST